MASNESSWLVKSSGRILGPYPTPRINELHSTREISVLDEISPPMRRWQTIQYHRDFRDVVESLRKANLSERTEATWTPGGTSGLTQTVTDLGNNDLTDEISAGLGGFTPGKEIVIHNIPEQVQITPPSGGRYQPTSGHATSIQRQVDRSARGLWIVTLVILVAAIVLILHRRIQDGGFESRPSADVFKQQVIDLVQVGRYAQALKELKAYFPDSSRAGDLGIFYGSLLIQMERQTVLGRRLLNEVIAARAGGIKQAYTGLGVADLIDGQLDSASGNFEKALTYDSEYVPAMVNMAVLHLKRGDFENAKKQALRALKISPLQGEAMVALAEAQVQLHQKKSNGADLNQVSRMSKDFLQRHWDYAAEVGLYSLYLDLLREDRSLHESIQHYLDRDPTLTSGHRHNVFIYKDHTDWGALARICEKVGGQLREGPRVAALLSSCYAHEGRWDAARQQIEKAVNQTPKDPLVQAWYSFIMRESGDPEQASVILGRATEFNRRGEYSLPALLQARFCQVAGDVSCARSSWQNIYERNPENLPALAGLAWVNVQAKSFSEAVKLIDRGLRISPDFIPLLELRRQAVAEGWYAADH
ncbi:MAG: tetratricopeptide repeat protein [Bdellovibrionales bacterium]